MTDGRGGEKGIGYRRPPFATRFKKGQSGNLRGRPRGRTRELPYEAVLGQMVTIRDGGVEKRLPADEAFLLYMMKNGLGEDVTAARTLLGTMEQADAVGWTVRPNAVRRIERVILAKGWICSALEPLRMATTLDRFRDTARMMLEPWLVQEALNRLSDERLTLEQQKVVFATTRTPAKVKWPEWWRKNG